MTRPWGNPGTVQQSGVRHVRLAPNAELEPFPPETKHPRLWRWVGLLIVLLSAATMTWLGYSIGEWIAS